MLADNRLNVRNKADKSDRINLFVTLLKGCLSIFSQLMVKEAGLFTAVPTQDNFVNLRTESDSSGKSEVTFTAGNMEVFSIVAV